MLRSTPCNFSVDLLETFYFALRLGVYNLNILVLFILIFFYRNPVFFSRTQFIFFVCRLFGVHAGLKQHRRVIDLYASSTR